MYNTILYDDNYGKHGKINTIVYFWLHCFTAIALFDSTTILTYLYMYWYSILQHILITVPSNLILHLCWQRENCQASDDTVYSCSAYFLSVFPLKTLPMSRTLPDFGMEGNVWGSHIDSRSSSSRVGAYMLNHCCVWKNLSK